MKVRGDIFKDIIGHDDVKSLLLKALKSYGDGLPVHFLLVGEPSSAKTMFLLALRRLKDSYYLLGSRASRSGLTSILIEKKPKVLLIDELDKMHPDNMAVLLSLMETGLVVEALHRRFRTEKLETIVVAAANDLSLIPKELLSRFIVLKFKPYSFREFCEVVVRTLTRREKVKRKLAKKIAVLVWSKLQSKDVRDALKLGRLIRRRQTEKQLMEVVKAISKYS